MVHFGLRGHCGRSHLLQLRRYLGYGQSNGLQSSYANPGAMQKRLKEEEGKPHGPEAHLVQLGIDLKERQNEPGPHEHG